MAGLNSVYMRACLNGGPLVEVSRSVNGWGAGEQVVALWLRSAAKEGDPPLEVAEEMDYAVTLNRALPEDIRVLGWTPVPEAFSARCASKAWQSCLCRPGYAYHSVAKLFRRLQEEDCQRILYLACFGCSL